MEPEGKRQKVSGMMMMEDGGGGGEVAGGGDKDAPSAFRLAERRYRLYKSRPASEVDMSEVFDFRDVEKNSARNRSLMQETFLPLQDVDVDSGGGSSSGSSSGHGVAGNDVSGTGNSRTLRAYRVRGVPGFVFVPGALSEIEQMRHALLCVKQYANAPHHTNVGKVCGLWEAYVAERLNSCGGGSGGQSSGCSGGAGKSSGGRPCRCLGERDDAEAAAMEEGRAGACPCTRGGCCSGEEEVQCHCRGLGGGGGAVPAPEGGGKKTEEKRQKKTGEKRPASGVGSPMGRGAAATALRGLRWVTVGWHYNWRTDLYEVEERFPFPPVLGNASSALAEAASRQPCLCSSSLQPSSSSFQPSSLPESSSSSGSSSRTSSMPSYCPHCGCGEGRMPYLPQAGIINFYYEGKTMTGHQDKSECTFDAPIVSWSLGRSAIFLLGSSTRDVPPVACLLRSGDCILMDGHSRVAFHGIPRIMDHSTLARTASLEQWMQQQDNAEELEVLWDFLQTCRINMNVRQVLPDATSPFLCDSDREAIFEEHCKAAEATYNYGNP